MAAAALSMSCESRPPKLLVTVNAPQCEARWYDYRLEDPRCYDLQERLAEAASKSDIPKMREALEQGANINGGYEQSMTALWYTAFAGESNAVWFLIDNGAKVNKMTDVGNTALMPPSITIIKISSRSL